MTKTLLPRKQPNNEQGKRGLVPQDIKEVEAWKKLMSEDPDAVATYIKELDNKLNFSKYLFQKRNETKET